jgi:hypothetical protein
MKSLDTTHAKDSYTAIDIVRYFENIYARTFHGQILSGFSPDLVTSMQKVYAVYREGVMKNDHTYQRLFRTAFYRDLVFQMDAKINETLGLEVVKPSKNYEMPSKMKLIFEDGVLLSSLLGYGWIPFSATLGFELRK